MDPNELNDELDGVEVECDDEEIEDGELIELAPEPSL